MTKTEIELRLAAAGYRVKKKVGRKSKIKLDLRDPEILYRIKLMQLHKVLDSVGGSIAKASKILGIHRTTIWRWLEEEKN